MALMYRADSSTARFAAASDPFRTASALSAFRVFSYDFCHCGKSGNLDENSAAESVTARISEFIFLSPSFVLPDPPLPPKPPPKLPPEIVQKTREKYLEALSRLTGTGLS